MELVANSWMLRIVRRDGKPDEEQYCADEAEARQLMGLLDDPGNADMYRSIALIRVDWYKRAEQTMDAINFEEETT